MYKIAVDIGGTNIKLAVINNCYSRQYSHFNNERNILNH